MVVAWIQNKEMIPAWSCAKDALDSGTLSRVPLNFSSTIAQGETISLFIIQLGYLILLIYLVYGFLVIWLRSSWLYASL